METAAVRGVEIERGERRDDGKKLRRELLGALCAARARPLGREILESVVDGDVDAVAAETGDETQGFREARVDFTEKTQGRFGDVGVHAGLESFARGAVPERIFDAVVACLESERPGESKRAVVEVPAR